MSDSVLPMFSSKSFIVSGLTFRSLIYFEFTFVYGVRKCSAATVAKLLQSCPTLCNSIFTELEQIISQFVWKYKKISNSQSNLEKEEWNWGNQPA